MVERRITGEPTEIIAEEVTVETPDELTVDNIEMTEDGGALVNPMSEQMEVEFDSNLAEYMDEKDLQDMSSDLVGDYKEDSSSREEWYDAYAKGLKLLGFKYEDRSQPFQGASGVTHPLLSETVTQFQAQAYKELLPANGPVRTQLIGKADPQKEQQAQRVQDFMNYQIMHVMEDFDPDLDQMLFYLPLSGSSFKKVYYDSTMGRAVSKFIPSEELIVPYTATDLGTAERITHVLKRTENDIRKLQVTGFYRDVDLEEYEDAETNSIQTEVNRLDGVKETGSYKNDSYTLLEMHVDLDVPGFEDPDGIKLPYIVTIDEGSGNVLSVYRNYDEQDSLKKELELAVDDKKRALAEAENTRRRSIKDLEQSRNSCNDYCEYLLTKIGAGAENGPSKVDQLELVHRRFRVPRYSIPFGGVAWLSQVEARLFEVVSLFFPILIVL